MINLSNISDIETLMKFLETNRIKDYNNNDKFYASQYVEHFDNSTICKKSETTKGKPWLI